MKQHKENDFYLGKESSFFSNEIWKMKKGNTSFSPLHGMYNKFK